MAEALRLIPLCLGLYAGLGLVFGAAFVFWGAGRLDDGMARAKLTVRLLLLPGSLALWPLLLARWLGAHAKAPQQPEHGP